MIERMELDETGFPQPTGELEELEADSLVLALGQDTDLSLLDGVPGLEVEDGVVEVGPNMMTGHPGHLRRRRHGPRRAHRDGRPSATARRPRGTSTPGSAERAHEPPAEARARRVRAASTPGTTRTLRAPCSPRSSWRAAQSTFDEVVGGLDESNALFEARRCLSCGNCFSCDNCFGVCPDNAVRKTGDPAAPLRDRPRLLQGLRHLRRRVPRRRDRPRARDDLAAGCGKSEPLVVERQGWRPLRPGDDPVDPSSRRPKARSHADDGAEAGPRRRAPRPLDQRCRSTYDLSR